MRSRRALARPALALAATLIPAALLSGTVATTAAYATDSPSLSASAPASASETSGSPAPSSSPSPSGSASASASVSPSVSASPSASEPPTSDGCPVEPGEGDEILYNTVSGETDKLVADGAWRKVTFTTENRSDSTLKDISRRLTRFAYDNAPDAQQRNEVIDYVDVQYWDTKSRTWQGPTWDEVQLTAWLPSITSIAPQKTVTLSLRIKVDKDMPHGRFPDLEQANIGSGWLYPGATAVTYYGVCGYGDNWAFTIHKPGTGTGDGDGGGNGGGATSTPTTGTGGGSTPTPQTATTAPVTPDSTPTGDLAHTGSSSALPVIAGVGAVAVGLGAGAVYVVRRRRSGTGTHA